jgi:hypothetical protein
MLPTTALRSVLRAPASSALRVGLRPQLASAASPARQGLAMMGARRWNTQENKGGRAKLVSGALAYSYSVDAK